jgi:hypothetical protein
MTPEELEKKLNELSTRVSTIEKGSTFTPPSGLLQPTPSTGGGYFAVKDAADQDAVLLYGGGPDVHGSHNSHISVGGNQFDGALNIFVKGQANSGLIQQEPAISLDGTARAVRILDDNGVLTTHVHAGAIYLGTPAEFFDTPMLLNGTEGYIRLGSIKGKTGGKIELIDPQHGSATVTLDSSNKNVQLYDNGVLKVLIDAGTIYLGAPAEFFDTPMLLNGPGGYVRLGSIKGKASGKIELFDSQHGDAAVTLDGGHGAIGQNTQIQRGYIQLLSNGKPTLSLSGIGEIICSLLICGKASINGGDGTMSCNDVVLSNGDCAEEFESETLEIETGDVVVLNEAGRVERSRRVYDTRVAGVVAGAGTYKPAILLDRKPGRTNRIAIGLLGKVYCKVDATKRSIAPGDLLTTGPCEGHAMKATDRRRRAGAILGKALGPLPNGRGLIPVLLALA